MPVLLDLSDVQQAEIGYCARCRSVVEITTDGPCGYGRTVERCTNPRCVNALPHRPTPEPNRPTPKNPSRFAMGLYRSVGQLAEVAANQTKRDRRRAKLIASGLHLDIKADFTAISR